MINNNELFEDKKTSKQRVKRIIGNCVFAIVLGILLGLLLIHTAYAYEYTPKEIVLIGKVAHHEAGNQTELGKRLVIDTILNRVESDAFPNTVADVLSQSGQYCNPEEFPDRDMYRLVAEEVYNRTNNRVLWYRTKQYHKYGEPIVIECNHYFSGK